LAGDAKWWRVLLGPFSDSGAIALSKQNTPILARMPSVLSLGDVDFVLIADAVGFLTCRILRLS